ncbi:MAG: hypothetical protein COA69_11955 [Robiginitomaculum sp.]|nr:MAG: hypothetical protein COA69_11955 [Robiginitomaculum sp.]
MRIFLLFLCAVCLLAQPASLAHAQSKKELAAQNVRLAQRLTILENRMLTGDPAAERLMQRMDALEASQRAQTGEVERLRYERDTLQDEVRALAENITQLQSSAEASDRHLQAVDLVAERGGYALSGQSGSGQSGSGLSDSGQDVYGGSRIGGGLYSNGSSIAGPPTILEGGSSGTSPAGMRAGMDVSQLAAIGLDKMEEGNFSQAQIAFKQYLELNENAPDRGDVYFWLGETHYVMGGYADAADAYIASMRAAPKGIFAPDAMIRLASTARALGNTDMACQTLASFPGQFPRVSSTVRTKAAREAQRSGC